MASENKKKKLKNSHMYKTYLKVKGSKFKKLHFYNPSERKKLNEETKQYEIQA